MSSVVIPGYDVVDLRFLVRGGTAANLAAVNEIPFVRELIVERDTLKMKLGDGVTHYNDLDYIATGGGGGSAWLNGSGAPDPGDGANGDYYLDVDTGDVYAKAAGTWTLIANIKGSSSGQLFFGAGDRVNPVPIGPKALVPCLIACTISDWVMVIYTDDGVTGDVTVDIQKVAYADFTNGRPNSGDSIVVTTLGVSAAYKADGDSASFSELEVDEGDILMMEVLSRSSNVTHVALALKTEKL